MAGREAPQFAKGPGPLKQASGGNPYLEAQARGLHYNEHTKQFIDPTSGQPVDGGGGGGAAPEPAPSAMPSGFGEPMTFGGAGAIPPPSGGGEAGGGSLAGLAAAGGGSGAGFMAPEEGNVTMINPPSSLRSGIGNRLPPELSRVLAGRRTY